MASSYQSSDTKYVLVTAAYNEEAFIEKTLQSVVAQTALPTRWIIVSDGSTDRTDEIVETYARRYSFIQLIRKRRTEGRNFGSKVRAVQVGFDALRASDYAFIGNLDADLSFQPDYFQKLLDRFIGLNSLGIAGGWICESDGHEFIAREFNVADSVPHAVHLLRRECYQQIGDYLPLKYGGEDTCAVVTARMRGWQARAFCDLPVFHHRRTATVGGVFKNRLRKGMMDYSLGYHAGYAVMGYLRRVRLAPRVIGSILQLAGFGYGYVRREPRMVSDEFVAFLRSEQRQRLNLVVRRYATLQRHDGSPTGCPPTKPSRSERADR